MPHLWAPMSVFMRVLNIKYVFHFLPMCATRVSALAYSTVRRQQRGASFLSPSLPECATCALKMSDEQIHKEASLR